jgi:hypothetical protein
VVKSEKSEPLVHVVLVDTNILWLEDKGPVANPEFDKFWDEHKTLLEMELLIPEMVRDELLVQHCSSGQKLMARVSENLATLSTITTKKHRHRLSVDGMKKSVRAKFDRWIDEREAKIAETPIDDIDWKDLCKKSTWRMPPFTPASKDSKGREIEKGLRDALILETVASVVKKETRNVNIVFICADEFLRGCTTERLREEKNFHVFAQLADFSSYIKLTREKLEKQFSEKLVKRAAERFYTRGDAQCLWTKENLLGKFASIQDAWKIEQQDNEPTQSVTGNVSGAQRSLLTALEDISTSRWMAVTGFYYYLGPHEFAKKTGRRTYHWESAALAIRKFALISKDLKRLDERVQFVTFRVSWRADVKADVRFYDLTLDECKFVKREFRIPTPDEVAQYGIDRMAGLPEQT